MTQRKLRRRWRWKGRARRQRAYKHNAELHAYEDRIIVALIRERGSASVAEWTRSEPNRWRPRQLAKALQRLWRAGVLDSSTRHSGWARRRTTIYTLRKQERKAA